MQPAYNYGQQVGNPAGQGGYNAQPAYNYGQKSGNPGGNMGYQPQQGYPAGNPYMSMAQGGDYPINEISVKTKKPVGNTYAKSGMNILQSGVKR